MTQHIDFLPESHRSKRKRQRTLRWRQTVVIAFLAIVVGGGVKQRRERVRLESERDRISAQAKLMNDKLTDPAVLRERIAVLDRRAELATQLRLRTPPTRVLHAITNSLPRFVSLTEYRSSFITPSSTASRSGQTTAAAIAAAGSAIERDLVRLRTARRERPLVVTIKGLAVDDLSISRFLSRLQGNPTFGDVRLIYTDAAMFDRQLMRRFEIRLQVRPLPAAVPQQHITSAASTMPPGRSKAGRSPLGENRS